MTQAVDDRVERKPDSGNAVQRLSHFTIAGKIGAGGMGEVYRARDEMLQRDIALKLLPASLLGDATARARLLREARSAAVLSHPNICVIHEVGEASGQAFIAMECVEGETLAARMARAPLSLSEVVRFGLQLADALVHAHERGVIHRDLKPANVMITPDQRVKVLDFGLAKFAMENRESDFGAATDIMVTRQGAIFGTPAYMAPEQLRGQPADMRSDIWALGVILHELVSGRRPFEGKTLPELSAAILATPPSALPASVPAELRAVIDRCLEKEPGSRYQHAVEIRSALELIQAGVISGGTILRPEWPRRWGTFAAAAVGILVLIAAAIAWSLNRSTPAPVATAPAEVAPVSLVQASVAVLPFENFSGRDDEYFADAMQDAVIGELARVKDLRVISRTSTLPFRKSGKGAAEIARALSTENLVEGSVTHAGDRIRVQVKLIKAGAQERQVWSEVYERELRDAFALYGEIARAVALQVDSRLAPSVNAVRTGSTRQVDPEIYRLYLRGVYQLHKGGEEGFASGIKLLREALEKDPGNPLPYAWLALAYATRAHDRLGTPEDLDIARAAARKAVQLDPDVAEAYAGLALINLYDDWDWESAETNFVRALELNPSLAETRRHYAWFLVTQGKFDEALAQQKRARDDDPLDGVKQSDVGWIAMIMGRTDEALREMRKGVELAPENAAVYQPLGTGYLEKGMFPEALETHKTMVKLVPEYEGLLARTLILVGRKAEAQPIIEKLKKDPSGDAAYCLAMAYEALGEKDEAIRWATAIRDRRHIWTPWMGTFVELKGLRGDPRFEELLASIKLK